jgi:hypothetical protein
MPTTEYIRLILDVATLFSVVVAFVWLNHGLYPVLKLKIELAEEHQGLLFIRLEVENKSKVHAKVHTGTARLQIIELDASQMKDPSLLSDWVPFDDGPRGEKPIAVMTSTEYVEPSESITVERLHRLSAATVAVHCGFQVLTKTKKIIFFHNPTDRFTTTAWVLTISGRAAVGEAAA